MTITKVEKAEVFKPYDEYEAGLRDFMDMDIQMACVSLDTPGYKKLADAFLSFYETAQRRRFPIDVTCKNGELYLIRTDM